MKNIIQKSILILIVIGLCSCNDFLKETSQDEVIPSSVEDLDQLLAYDGYPRRELEIMPFLLLLDDDVTQETNSSNQQLFIKKLSYLYLWGGRGSANNEMMFENYQNQSCDNSTAEMNIDSYATLYKLISGCNVVLDLLEDVSGANDTKKRVRGEALVLRSFYYFNLVNLYAYPYNAPNAPNGQAKGVPLKLKSEIEPSSVSISSVAEVYNSITKDVEEGIQLLTDVESAGTKFRIGIRAAHLLASRYYLYMENWEKAAEHATTFINTYNGTLPLLDMTTVEYPALTSEYGQTFPYPMNLNNSEIIFCYANRDENDLMSAAWASQCFYASNELVECFANNDQRSKGYLARYSSDGQLKSSKRNQDFQFGSYLRTSEAYLNRAEAYIQLAKAGQSELLDKAIKDLNTLREKRILNYTSEAWNSSSFNNNADQALEACKEERRREFCFEGTRWFDQRRYGMESFSHFIDESTNSGDEYTIEIGTASSRWVLPIMQAHKESNPALN